MTPGADTKFVRPGLYLFHRVTIFFIVYVQFQNILGLALKAGHPLLSHAVFLADKVFFWGLLAVFLYARLLGGCLLGGKNAPGKKARFVPVLKSELIFFSSLALFSLWCFFSGSLNRNPLPVTVFGTLAYLGFCFVFFVYSSIPYPGRLIKSGYSFLLRFALFLSLISLVQEILAFAHPASVDWWWNVQKGTSAVFRFGLFRAPSLLGHPNTISIFALFFFTVELARFRSGGGKRGWGKIAILGLAIVFSVSQTAIAAAALAGVLLLLPFRKVMAAGALIVALGLVWFLELETRRTLPEKEDKAGVTYDKYREYCREISLLIFRDHPLAGVGPGMYGGHISLKYGSPVYAAYGFDGRHLRYLSERVGSIEQQWAQALAETGAVGLGLLLVVIFTPAYILYRLRRREQDLFVRALMKALMVMPFLMIVYMFGFTVMQQRIWLIPYYIFAGALTGYRRRTETGPLTGPG